MWVRLQRIRPRLGLDLQYRLRYAKTGINRLVTKTHAVQRSMKFTQGHLWGWRTSHAKPPVKRASAEHAIRRHGQLSVGIRNNKIVFLW